MSVAGYGHLETCFSKLRQQKYLALLAPILGVRVDWILHGVNPSIPGIPETLDQGWASAKHTTSLTKEQRENLGKRARERRKALNYGLTAVANALGIKENKLKNLEFCLSVRCNEATEDKWEDVLGVPRGWLRDLQQSTTPALKEKNSTKQVELPPCANVSEEIRCIGAWLTRNEPLYRKTQYSLLNANEQRLANIFAERYGVAGEELSTLQSIGDRYGVTRERIRQVVDKMIARAGDFTGRTEQIEKLALKLPALLPQTTTRLNESLRSELGESLSLEGLDRFTRDVLGRSVVTLVDPQPTNPSAGGLIAVDKGRHDEEAFRVVRAVSLSMIRSTGAAQINFVAGAAGTELQRAFTACEVARLCSLANGFDWLVEADGWFWFGPDRDNRLLTVAQKVLACAQQRVDVEDIHGAMARSRREYFEPGKSRTHAIDAPHAVLISVLKKTPWIQNIQHDDFRLREIISPGALLSETELALYKLLISKGGVAARYTIEEELLDSEQYRGSSVALSVALDGSPIFLRLDRGIFGLRGASIKPDAFVVASAAVGGSNAKKRQNVVIDSEGFISFEFVLRENSINSRYWELPGFLAEYITEGDFEFSGEPEPVTYKIYPKGARRLNRFVAKLVRAGFNAGDLVALRLHPKRRLFLIDGGAFNQRVPVNG